MYRTESKTKRVEKVGKTDMLISIGKQSGESAQSVLKSVKLCLQHDSVARVC